MLRQLAGQHQPHGSLDLSATQSRFLIVGGQLASLSGNTFKNIIDEGVHDGHTLLGDTGVGVDLLEDLVDVGGVGFDTLLAALLGVGGCLLGCLGWSLLGWSLSHG